MAKMKRSWPKTAPLQGNGEKEAKFGRLKDILEFLILREGGLSCGHVS
jgi:hypothetical protein